MDFKELSEKRYSLRCYDANKPVEREKIDYLLRCAQLAPSAVNRQPYKLLIISNKKLLHDLATCYQRDWFANAPLCIVACANHDEAWHRPSDNKDHADIDVAIVVEHIILAATEQGLGSCWVCNFDAEKCAKLLHLPQHIEPVALLPIGYAAAENTIPPKKRKPLDELTSYFE